MNNCIFALMDAVALTSAALDNNHIDSTGHAVADKALFKIWVTEENGARSLVRENVTAKLASALVSSANHGAKVQGLARTYEAVQLEAIN